MNKENPLYFNHKDFKTIYKIEGGHLYFIDRLERRWKECGTFTPMSEEEVTLWKLKQGE